MWEARAIGWQTALVPLMAACLLLQGCTAFINDDAHYRVISSRTRLYERTDGVIKPTQTWAQVALFPMALPLAYGTWATDVVGLFVDSLIINPPRFFWHGFRTGWDFLWKDPSKASSPFRQVLWTTFKVVITPPTIVAACMVHAFVIGDEGVKK